MKCLRGFTVFLKEKEIVRLRIASHRLGVNVRFCPQFFIKFHLLGPALRLGHLGGHFLFGLGRGGYGVQFLRGKPRRLDGCTDRKENVKEDW